jgi:hypothetical protein
MNFVQELRDLSDQYDKGTVPAAAELLGEYSVVVPWFPWISFAPLKHRKAVGPGGDGENILLGNLRFGGFRLERQEGSLLINYDLSPNNPIMRRVVDRLRRLPDGRLVGKLYYRVLGREVPLFFFEMRPNF